MFNAIQTASRYITDLPSLIVPALSSNVGIAVVVIAAVALAYLAAKSMNQEPAFHRPGQVFSLDNLSPIPKMTIKKEKKDQ